MQTTKSALVPTIILGSLFFIFGFVTWLNGILIPYFKIACELNDFQSLLVTFAFYISYFLLALPSSWILQKTGLKNGMMLGLLVMAVGALMFIPAANSRTYALFLTGLFIIGTGLSILQTASNPYITIIGPIESAAKRISIMGICNKVAGVLAPIILGAIILSDADVLEKNLQLLDSIQREDKLDELASRVIGPYTLMASILAGLAVMVRFSSLPEIEAPDEEILENNDADKKKSILQFPHLILGVVALFLYVGVEVIAGDTISLLGQEQGISLSDAKFFTSITLIAMVLGYFLGVALIPKFISQAKALTMSAILGIILSLLAINIDDPTLFSIILFDFTEFKPLYISITFPIVCIALLGLANALMWPAIWPLSIKGLGRYTKIGSALLIMAIAGGAILPLLYGSLADVSGIGRQHAYWILVPCYLFILFYSLKGYKLKSWR